MEKIKNILAYMCMTAIFIIMPFYYEDGYFDMIEAKTKILWFLSVLVALYMLGLIIQLINDIVCKSNNMPKMMKIDFLDGALFFFMFVNIVSCFLSDDPQIAFFGSDGWRMGTFSIMILFFLYVMISRSCYEEFNMVLLGIVMFVIFLLGLTDAFRMDLLGLHRYIANDYYDYIATIGNTNWYAGYLVMILAVLIMYMFESKKKISYIIYMVLIDLCMLNIIVCNCDSAYLSLSVIAICIIHYIIDRKYVLIRFGVFLINIGAMYGVVWEIRNCYKGDFVLLRSLSVNIIDNYIWIAIIAIGTAILIGMLANKKLKNTVKESSESIDIDQKADNITCKETIWYCNKEILSRYVHILVNILFLISAVIVLCIQIKNFDDKWGTDRGIVWKGALKLYSEFDLKDKIIGVGPDCFTNIFMEEYEGKVVNIYNNAHNEFIQYLFTTGILGLIAYCIVWVGVVIKYRKASFDRRTAKFNYKRYAYIVAAFAYLSQAVVNNPLSLTMAILIVFMGFIHNKDRENCNNQNTITNEEA